MELNPLASDISDNCCALNVYVSDYATYRTTGTNYCLPSYSAYLGGQYQSAYGGLQLAVTNINEAALDHSNYIRVLNQTKDYQSEFDFLLMSNGY